MATYGRVFDNTRPIDWTTTDLTYAGDSATAIAFHIAQSLNLDFEQDGNSNDVAIIKGAHALIVTAEPDDDGDTILTPLVWEDKWEMPADSDFSTPDEVADDIRRWADHA